MNNRLFKAIAAVIFVFALAGIAATVGYADMIPPEIFRQYDPDIVNGKRPVVVRITQSMISSLPDKPDQGGDVYSFNLDPDEMSSAEKYIIRRWVMDGHKIMLWGFEDAEKYWTVFSDVISYERSSDERISEFNEKIEKIKAPLTLSKHSVNTGVRDLNFAIDFYNPYYSNYDPKRKDFRFINRYPPDTEVVVSLAAKILSSKDKGGMLAGRVPYGNGSIYVAIFDEYEEGNSESSDRDYESPGQWEMGMDRDRWTLNFFHWMLGLPVPGATGTVGSRGKDARKGVQTQDRILLKNGDTVSGQILIEAFTVKTSYANLSFDLPQIDRVVLEGGGSNIESIVLRNGDKLSGVVGPDRIQVKLTGGQDTEIEKDKIQEIVLRQ